MTLATLAPTVIQLAQRFLLPLLKSLLGKRFAEVEDKAYSLIEPIFADMLAAADAAGIDLTAILESDLVTEEIYRFTVPYLLKIERTLRAAGLTEVTR